MSLQVCHCGWSKVTTHQGLRIHQGKKGCTPKGVRTAETQQEQCQWGYRGFPNVQTDIKLEIRTSANTDKANYYSELSLQVCHCGWSKMTTCHGLRTHQGIMGCTAKGMKREQYIWKNEWEAEADRNYPPAKKEHLAETQRTTSYTMFAAATVTIKDEYKSPSAVPQHSSQRATQSSHQLQDFSLVPQINRPARDRSTPAYPGNVVKPKERKIKNPPLSQNADRRSVDPYTQLYAAMTATIKEEPESPFALQQQSSRRIANSRSGHQLQALSALSQNTARRSVDECFDSDTELYAAPASTIKEEPESPFAVQELPSRRATKTNSGHRLRDFSADAQVNSLVREPPANPPLFTVVRPKVKDGKGTKMRSVARKLPSTSVPVPVVQPKEKKRDNHWTLSENTDRRSVDECWSIDSDTELYAAPAATIKEEPESPFALQELPSRRATKTNSGHRLQDFSADAQVNSLVREPPANPTLFTVVRPKKRSVARKLPSTSLPVPVVQPKEKKRDNHWTLSENINLQATTTTAEEPRSSFQTTQGSFKKDSSINAGHQLQQDISSSEQVDRSIRENPKTPPPNQPKKRESPSFNSTQERIKSELQKKLQMREEKMNEIRQVEAVCESIPDSTSTNARTDSTTPQNEDPTPLNEATRPDCSTSMKVKELAQMFSAVQETALQPEEEKDREEQTQSKNVPASPVINKQTTAREELRSPFTTPQRSLQKDTDIHADHQLQEISEEMERSVRENPKTPPLVQPKKKDSPLFKVTQERIQSESQQKIQMREEKRGEIRPPEAACEVKELAQMFSTVQETAVQPEEKKDREGQELSQNQPVSPIINSQTTTTTEEPRSPFTTPRCSLPKDTNVHADHQLRESSERVEGSVRENPKTPPPVLPKKKDSPLFKATQGRVQSELQQKIQMTEEKMSGTRPVETSCESISDSTTTNTQTDSAPGITSQKETQTSSCGAAQPGLSTGMTVKQLAQMFSAVQETAVQPEEEKDREEQTQSKNVPASPVINPQTTAREELRSPFTTPQRSLRKDTDIHADHQLQEISEQMERSVTENPKTPPPVQPKKKDLLLFKVTQESASQQKNQMREEKRGEIRPTEAAHECIPDSADGNIQTESVASQKEDPTSLYEAEQPDFSTCMKVKELARMFSAPAARETAVQPKDKDREERKLSQVKLLAQRFSTTTTQETAVQPKGNAAKPPKLLQRFPDSKSATINRNSQATALPLDDVPKPSCESSELSGFSTAVKVKDLARMFSGGARQEKPVQPMDKQREEQKPAQVKLLIQKLSTPMAQETATSRPKEKDKENQKPSKRT